jgi:2'-5' RNA ligase
MSHSISFSLEFDKKFSNKIKKLYKLLEKNLKVSYYQKNHSLPHINLLSGKTKNIKEIKKLKISSKGIKLKVKFVGIGVFPLSDHNIVFLRFENSNKLQKLRKKLFKKTKKYFFKIDKTCSDLLWIPKCTVASNDVNNNKLSKVIKILTKFKFENISVISKICILDYTFKEVKISEIKI